PYHYHYYENKKEKEKEEEEEEEKYGDENDKILSTADQLEIINKKNLLQEFSDDEYKEFLSLENICQEHLKKTKQEAEFQQDISSVYFTPAVLRLPIGIFLPIKSVSIGLSHIAILDNYGQVFASGTFIIENSAIGLYGKAGHYPKYQRNFIHVRHCQKQNNKIGPLPCISKISSGAHHFLMLSVMVLFLNMVLLNLDNVCQIEKLIYCLVVVEKFFMLKVWSHLVILHVVITITLSFQKIVNIFIAGDKMFIYNVAILCRQIKYTLIHIFTILDMIAAPKIVNFYENDNNENGHCDTYEKNNIMNYDSIGEIKQICAGNHFTVLLTMNHQVFTFGRNACRQLGRGTFRNDPVRKMDSNNPKDFVWQEASPDLCRLVTLLDGIKIDWIGAGTDHWFAHDSDTGHVYAFGDSSEGRCGVGKWKSARGRSAFDHLNIDLNLFNVAGAVGGSNHSLFLIQPKASSQSSQQSFSFEIQQQQITFSEPSKRTLSQISSRKEGDNDNRKDKEASTPVSKKRRTTKNT
ncbi:hypothetical protein RFI_14017, partial [Reticulomyxa filosa]